MHSTQCPEPDQAGQNLMLNSPELAEALRPRISALNYLGESARLRRRLEDAEMRANDLQKALSTARRENDVLRMIWAFRISTGARCPRPTLTAISRGCWGSSARSTSRRPTPTRFTSSGRGGRRRYGWRPAATSAAWSNSVTVTTGNRY